MKPISSVNVDGDTVNLSSYSSKATEIDEQSHSIRRIKYDESELHLKSNDLDFVKINSRPTALIGIVSEIHTTMLASNERSVDYRSLTTTNKGLTLSSSNRLPDLNSTESITILNSDLTGTDSVISQHGSIDSRAKEGIGISCVTDRPMEVTQMELVDMLSNESVSRPTTSVYYQFVDNNTHSEAEERDNSLGIQIEHTSRQFEQISVVEHLMEANDTVLNITGNNLTVEINALNVVYNTNRSMFAHTNRSTVLFAGCSICLFFSLAFVTCFLIYFRRKKSSSSSSRRRKMSKSPSEDSMNPVLFEQMIRAELARGRAKLYSPSATSDDENETDRLPGVGLQGSHPADNWCTRVILASSLDVDSSSLVSPIYKRIPPKNVACKKSASVAYDANRLNQSRLESRNELNKHVTGNDHVIRRLLSPAYVNHEPSGGVACYSAWKAELHSKTEYNSDASVRSSGGNADNRRDIGSVKLSEVRHCPDIVTQGIKYSLNGLQSVEVLNNPHSGGVLDHPHSGGVLAHPHSGGVLDHGRRRFPKMGQSCLIGGMWSDLRTNRIFSPTTRSFTRLPQMDLSLHSHDTHFRHQHLPRRSVDPVIDCKVGVCDIPLLSEHNNAAAKRRRGFRIRLDSECAIYRPMHVIKKNGYELTLSEHDMNNDTEERHLTNVSRSKDTVV